jgi:ribonuclease HII
MCERFYDDSNRYELCIDEAGRGCLFGRVYISCVVLPKDPTSFDGTDIKDSKKFSSKKKINQVSEYIKENAFAWHTEYVDAEEIDRINILQCVIKGMHNCIKHTIDKLKELDNTVNFNDITAVIDGNYFKPYSVFNEDKNQIETLKHVTVEQGDAKYMGIAAASILAKTSRDAYILDICDKYPKLDEYYGFKKNVGYGTKQHLEGIKTYGISKWHRKTFGQHCRNAHVIEIPESV